MWKISNLLLISSLGLAVLAKEVQGFVEFKDAKTIVDGGFKNHPCNRECRQGESFVCEYELAVHYREALGPECINCIDDPTACADEQCIYADGVPNILMTVNNQWPAPPIVVCENDIVVAHVTNYLDEDCTMHWHGMHMSLSKDMDGAPYVTQYPIAPQQSYYYVFPVDRHGTIWYHSHMFWQRALGVAGPMVIRQPKELDAFADLYDYDLDEHILLITDTLYNLDQIQPHNILVNGKGRNHLNSLPDNDAHNRYERITVSQGKRYRMRIISNGVTNCPIKVTIENHIILAIATDGNDMEPMSADNFYLTSAERLDFILEANQAPGKYWIKFEGNFDCVIRNLYQGAILQYEESLADGNSHPETNMDSVGTQTFGRQLNVPSEFQIIPQSRAYRIGDVSTVDLRCTKPLPWPADAVFHTIYTSFGLLRAADQVHMQVDGITFDNPEQSLLQAEDGYLETEQICSPTKFRDSGVDCTTTNCHCTNVRQVPANKPIEIVVVNFMNSTHPFHLHGFTFRVVGQEQVGDPEALRNIEDLDRRGLLKRKPSNYPAVEKDTAQIPRLGYLIIRFISNNPGFWLYHCHIERHALLGMAGVVYVPENDTQ